MYGRGLLCMPRGVRWHRLLLPLPRCRSPRWTLRAATAAQPVVPVPDGASAAHDAGAAAGGGGSGLAFSDQRDEGTPTDYFGLFGGIASASYPPPPSPLSAQAAASRANKPLLVSSVAADHTAVAFSHMITTIHTTTVPAARPPMQTRGEAATDGPGGRRHRGRGGRRHPVRAARGGGRRAIAMSSAPGRRVGHGPFRWVTSDGAPAILISDREILLLRVDSDADADANAAADAAAHPSTDPRADAAADVTLLLRMLLGSPVVATAASARRRGGVRGTIGRRAFG